MEAGISKDSKDDQKKIELMATDNNKNKEDHDIISMIDKSMNADNAVTCNDKYNIFVLVLGFFFFEFFFLLLKLLSF